MRSLTSFVAALAACGPTAGAIDSGASGADADLAGPDAAANRPDAFIDPDRPDANTVCAEQDFDIELVPPSMMILLDRSASMNEELGGGSKWDQAQPAIEHLVTTYQHQILFGFNAFPSSDGLDACKVDDPIRVDVVDSTADNPEVTAAMWATTPEGGSTPLYCGLNILSDPAYAPRFNDPAAAKYVVVVSDGIDLCGVGCCTAFLPGWPPECSATTADFAALASGLVADHGIRTFVIGFADAGGDQVFEEQLDAIAAHGGTPFGEFLLASNQSQLEDAFDQIAGEVVSCTYQLEDPGEDAEADEVNVYFDGEVVGFDDGCADGGGWDWADPAQTSIVFCDQACDRLRALEVDNISVTFGCPSIVID